MRSYGILKSTAAVLILFAGLFGLVACSGVSQEEFDRVSEDLDDTRAQEQRISNDLSVAQSKVKDIETELKDTETELDDTRAQEQRISNDLSVAQSKVKDTETELDDARAKLAEYSKIVETDYPDLSLRAEQARLILSVFNGFLHIGFTDDTSGVVQLFGQLAEVENPEIQQSIEYLLENVDYMSEEEVGLLAMGWVKEAEKLLSK